MLLQDIECRIAHRAMAMTPDFIKECFFVPDQFHHPPHIRILKKEGLYPENLWEE